MKIDLKFPYGDLEEIEENMYKWSTVLGPTVEDVYNSIKNVFSNTYHDIRSISMKVDDPNTQSAMFNCEVVFVVSIVKFTINGNEVTPREFRNALNIDDKFHFANFVRDIQRRGAYKQFIDVTQCNPTIKNINGHNTPVRSCVTIFGIITKDVVDIISDTLR